jgi:hypothetical protein
MFSPLDRPASARPSAWRAALKRTADRALAFATLEGYDTDDVRERLAAQPAATAATVPDLLTALSTTGAPDAATAALPRRTRPTDPHAAAPTSVRRAGSSRRPSATAAVAACTTPVTPGTRATRA